MRHDSSQICHLLHSVEMLVGVSSNGKHVVQGFIVLQWS